MSFVQYFAFTGLDSSALARSPLRAPECGLTLRASGPMKSGVDEENRKMVFRSIGVSYDDVAACRQIHSRVVRIADRAASFRGLPEGDGILTVNASVVPSVTVADCMPIWLYDPVSGFFGVLHSGWKGTGILRAACELAADEWGASAANVRVILGPHIRSCCYTVDMERADYFASTFGRDSVQLDPERDQAGDRWPYRLSLAKANMAVAREAGIDPAHVHDSGVCTSCDPKFGSSRREGADRFVHMAAFICSRVN